ncbi:MAG: C4-type zinc ribbon domain-containing protein [Phycisphaeraceae bacterium]
MNALDNILNLHRIDQMIERLRSAIESARNDAVEHWRSVIALENAATHIEKLREETFLQRTHPSEHRLLAGESMRLKSSMMAARRNVQSAESRMAQLQVECGATLEYLCGQREAILAKLSREHLSIYSRLISECGHEPLALVEIRDPQRMECACTGCCMTIPGESVRQLRSGRDLIQCPTCSRILYLCDADANRIPAWRSAS